ncbi:hypothetical protein IX51_03480 [uncultured archaeon]|nr:hypothetical protein IX51_03480 [uncultured archaeon]
MKLNVMGRDRTLDFKPSSLIIAGFTGKDRASTERHIKELADIGVPVPERVPAFFVLNPDLVSTFDRITVSSRESSGEVEPVLINVKGELFIGVGSDHTARDVEKESIAESKSSCQKPISCDVMEYGSLKSVWDSIEIRSWVKTGSGMVKYQEGSVSQIMDIPDLLKELKSTVDVSLENSVLFLGTLPLLAGNFVYGDEFEVELRVPSTGAVLHHSYTVKIGD